MEHKRKLGPRALGSRAGAAAVVALLAVGCGPADPPTLGVPASRESGPEDRRGGVSGRETGRAGAGTHKGDLSGKQDRDRKSPPVEPKPSDQNPAATGKTFVVADVIDGDTIEVTRDSGSESVRLIGIDTPESVHPTEPVECFGPRSSDYTSRTLFGERIRLEFDDERRDHYGRLLAYVWLDGVLFNKLLVRRGFAKVTIYSPNDEYADLLYAVQAGARSHDRGLWAACPSGGRGKSTPEVEKAGGSNCDSNYSGACIPAYPPDIDCPDAGATNFKSVGSDPHGFDGDGDGIACEG